MIPWYDLAALGLIGVSVSLLASVIVAETEDWTVEAAALLCFFIGVALLFDRGFAGAKQWPILRDPDVLWTIRVTAEVGATVLLLVSLARLWSVRPHWKRVLVRELLAVLALVALYAVIRSVHWFVDHGGNVVANWVHSVARELGL